MLTRARRALILAGATALLALGAVTPAAAQKQTVVIYTAIENEQIAEYKKAYEKTLPNVDVKMLRLSTGDIAARFMAEKDNMQADVIWGVGATNMLQLQERGPARALRPEGPGARSSRSSATRPTRRPGSGSTSTCPPSASTPRPARSTTCPKPDVLGRSDQAGLQGPRGDAESGLVGHRLPLGGLDPAAHGRGGGLEVPRRARQEHRGVHEVGLQALQGLGGGRAGHRRVVRVRGPRDDQEGLAGRDGAAQGGLGLRDRGQRAHEEGRQEPGRQAVPRLGHHRRVAQDRLAVLRRGERARLPGARRVCRRTSARWSSRTTSTGPRRTATASWPSGRSDTPSNPGRG